MHVSNAAASYSMGLRQSVINHGSRLENAQNTFLKATNHGNGRTDKNESLVNKKQCAAYEAEAFIIGIADSHRNKRGIIPTYQRMTSHMPRVLYK